MQNGSKLPLRYFFELHNRDYTFGVMTNIRMMTRMVMMRIKYNKEEKVSGVINT